MELSVCVGQFIKTALFAVHLLSRITNYTEINAMMSQPYF